MFTCRLVLQAVKLEILVKNCNGAHDGLQVLGLHCDTWIEASLGCTSEKWWNLPAKWHLCLKGRNKLIILDPKRQSYPHSMTGSVTNTQGFFLCISFRSSISLQYRWRLSSDCAEHFSLQGLNWNSRQVRSSSRGLVRKDWSCICTEIPDGRWSGQDTRHAERTKPPRQLGDIWSRQTIISGD